MVLMKRYGCLDFGNVNSGSTKELELHTYYYEDAVNYFLFIGELIVQVAQFLYTNKGMSYHLTCLLICFRNQTKSTCHIGLIH